MQTALHFLLRLSLSLSWMLFVLETLLVARRSDSTNCLRIRCRRAFLIIPHNLLLVSYQRLPSNYHRTTITRMPVTNKSSLRTALFAHSQLQFSAWERPSCSQRVSVRPVLRLSLGTSFTSYVLLSTSLSMRPALELRVSMLDLLLAYEVPTIAVLVRPAFLRLEVIHFELEHPLDHPSGHAYVGD